MTINERFKIVINDLYKGNKRAFATTIGVNPSVIQNVTGKRQGKPSYELVEKVCANANISANWLILGIGEMTLKQGLNEVNSDTANPVIDKILHKISEQAEEIGRLKAEIENYKKALSGGTGETTAVLDAGYAAAG